MHMYTHTQIHTVHIYTCSYTHTHRCTHMHTLIHNTHIHTHTHSTHTHIHIHRCTQTHTHSTHMHTITHTDIHMWISTHAHTHTHCAHIHTDIHGCTHAYIHLHIHNTSMHTHSTHTYMHMHTVHIHTCTHRHPHTSTGEVSPGRGSPRVPAAAQGGRQAEAGEPALCQLGRRSPASRAGGQIAVLSHPVYGTCDTCPRSGDTKVLAEEVPGDGNTGSQHRG